ncbi:MAG: RsmB/NOP family class I SAM-dependent RNA methyltransferase [Rhodoluna sp.]
MANREIDKNPRSVALRLLKNVAIDGSYANLELPRLLARSGMDTRDKALTQELAFGTIRWQYFYDLTIEVCSRRHVSEIDIETLLVLRLGVHQLLATRIPAHAALDQSVELAKREVSRGASGFVNGVLRRISEKSREQWLQIVLDGVEDPHEILSIKYSHPIWIVKSLAQSLSLDGRPEELETLLKADNSAPLVQLVALGGIHVQVSDQLSVGPANPNGFTLKAGDPRDLAEFRSGLLRVQDQGSQLAALVLTTVKPIEHGEMWLDMCAGPGGKAALLASIAKTSKASLICNEISEHRAKLVRQALSAVDASVQVKQADARLIGDELPATFDRILLDAPCTGLGALRRRPEARWRKTVIDVSVLSKLQEQLLESAWKALKPEGVLAYVTCSPHVAETNSIIDWAKRKLVGYQLLDAREILHSINPQLILNKNRKTVQLWPHVHQTDAMFIALLQKTTTG